MNISPIIIHIIMLMPLSLEEGLSELEGCIAYPFEHEGFSKEESKILENLFSEFTGTKFAD